MATVLDSGGVSALTRHTSASKTLSDRLLRRAISPPVVPVVVLVECLTGDPAPVNRPGQVTGTRSADRAASRSPVSPAAVARLP
jgi:hypothetical protein